MVFSFRNGDWIVNGSYGGRLLKSAATAISAIGSDTSLCIEVLDSVHGDERLVTTLASHSLIDDMKLGRTGREWGEERYAIAENSVEIFCEFWPSMRLRLNDALLVSLVSTLENYIISLVVEFPSILTSSTSSETVTGGYSDYAWQVADKKYRNAVKTTRSTSRAWVKLCSESSIPDYVKHDVAQWMLGNDCFAIDEMVLLRNSIVHRAGVADEQLAQLLGIKVGDRVYATDRRVAKYRSAYLDFLCRIDPPL